MAKLIIQEESDIKNPLAFFEYFFEYGGYHKKLKQFHSHPEVIYDLVLDVNEAEDYIEYKHNNDEGISYPRRNYFITDIEKRLKYQSLISCNLIDNNINTISGEGKSIIHYLKLQFDKLIFLRRVILNDIVLSKYVASLASINQIILYLVSHYPSTISEIHSSSIEEIIKLLSSGVTLKTDNVSATTSNNSTKTLKRLNSTYFKWKNNSEDNTKNLYKVLTENGVVPNHPDTYKKFVKAFSGEPMNEPIKIVWMFYSRSTFTKPSLIRVIKLLMDELQLIEKIKNKNQLARLLMNIFVDLKGNPLKAVRITIQNLTPEEDFIEKDLLDKIRTSFKTDKAVTKTQTKA